MLIKNYGEIQAMINDWVEKYTHTQQQQVRSNIADGQRAHTIYGNPPPQ